MKGGTFINTVIKTLNLTATGTPIVFSAGAKLLIVKGYSKLSVQNTSSVISGKLKIEPLKKVD